MLKHEYSSLRKGINNENRFAKKDYYHKLFQNIKEDVKQTCIAINKVLKSKSSKQNLNAKSLNFNNSLYTDNFGISQAYNDHFAVIANKICEAVSVLASAVG